jgi:serine/threonine protein kinase
MIPGPNRTGQIFGSYELKDLIGQGGFAEVYRGVHTHIPQQQAAVKILIKQLVATKASQFEQEAQILATLNHPNIVRLTDYGLYSNPSLTTTVVPYIVMDYVPGGSVRKKYPKGTVLDMRRVLTYIQEIALALQYAHDRNIVHLDIKPENMLIGEQGQLLLSDFGLAKLFSEKNDAGGIQGTLSYMAPEQFDARPGFASDQYALGIVAYEWFSGKMPIRGSTFEEFYLNHKNTMPPSICALVPALPPTVEMVLMRALKKNPNDRYPRVSDFVHELELALNASSTQKASPRPFTPSPPPPTPAPQPTTPAARPPTPAPQPSMANESFFRPQANQFGQNSFFNPSIPASPTADTLGKSNFVPQNFPQPRPYSPFQAPVNRSGPASSSDSFTKTIQEIVQPLPSNLLRRKRISLYTGLGLHALGCIFLGVWYASVAPSKGNEGAWWFMLFFLLFSEALFSLFFVSRNSPLKLITAIPLSIYWALAGSAFASVVGTHILCFPDSTVSLVLFLFGSFGLFAWRIFKKVQ